MASIRSAIRGNRPGRSGKPDAGPPGASVDVRGVSKTMGQGRRRVHVLNDISIDVAPGQFVSIIGPSGCGKSTLFNLLAGLESPDSGEVCVNGQPAAGRSEAFAYMPQKDLLFPWRRVIDNAALGLEIAGVPRAQARAKIEPLLDVFGLSGFEQAYPSQLSGGMRQRVALLRTVVQGLPVLLLDEPFGALDYLTRTELQLWLADMWARFGWTAILVTHDVPEALLLSDRIYVLTARPATVRSVVEVKVPHPRSLDDLAGGRFGEIEKKLLDDLRVAHGAHKLAPGRAPEPQP